MLNNRKIFRNCDKGAVAIEFVILAPLFFAILFSIFEAGIYFYTSSVVEDTVARAARQVRAGKQIAAQDPSATDACTIEKDCFYDLICAPLKNFGSCRDNLSVEVIEFSTWKEVGDDLSTITCPDESGYNYDDMTYDRGKQLSIVRVRICYTIKLINPALGLQLSKSATGKRAIMSTILFRNEPYGDALVDETRPQ
ncbi:MAG: TadE/TadG family type IV pilus assembly protein [bacterium]